MSTAKFKTLIIDDSPQDIHLVLNELKDISQLNAAKSAQEGFELIKKQRPDLILLDVNMPEMDGYEACRILKQDPENEDIDVIFISANDATGEIIKGLELGAVDYVVKPYQAELLASKVRNTLHSSIERKKLKQQTKDINQLVTTMMSETSSLSTTITFLRSCFSSEDPKQLAETLIETLRSIHLNAVVFYKIDGLAETLSTRGDPSMLELELLSRLHNHSEPFVEKGERMFIAKKNLVLLIKNMPAEADKRGSLKDHLMTLLEGANSRLDYFSQLAQQSARKMALISAEIDKAKNTLSDISNKQAQHKKKSMAILDDMFAEVEESFFTMGLTDAQESQLLDILSNAVKQSLEHMESGLELDGEIKTVVGKLSKAATDAAS